MRSAVELLSAYLDDESLSSDEAEQLSNWVTSSPANAKVAVEYGMIDALASKHFSVRRFLRDLGRVNDPKIRQSLSSEAEAQLEPALHRAFEGRRLSTDNLRAWALALTSVAMAAAFLLYIAWPSRALESDHPRLVEAPTAKPLVATITDAIDLTGMNAASLRKGRPLTQDTQLVIESGVLTLAMIDGTEVVIEGPAEFVLVGPQQIALSAGRLAARLDEDAQGLDVITPTARVVDLGTEFGVSVGANLETKVDVFDGKVALFESRSEQDGERRQKLIPAGRSGYVDGSGKLAWPVKTVGNPRAFIRPDEISSRREAREGSTGAKQRVAFYSLQRIDGLLGFQSFDEPSAGGDYAFSFMPRSAEQQLANRLVDDVSPPHLYSSGSLEVPSGGTETLYLDTSTESLLSRSGLVTEQGHVGRDGSELWLTWTTHTVRPAAASPKERDGLSAGVSLTFGDQRSFNEPLFVGTQGDPAIARVVSNEGSRRFSLELDSDISTFVVDKEPLSPGLHTWIAHLVFGRRGDRVAIWCDVPFDQVPSRRPNAEFSHSNIIFDRIRLEADPSSPPVRFDQIVLADRIDALATLERLIAQSRTPDDGSSASVERTVIVADNMSP